MSLPHTDAALVVLCKRPRVGEGKQRLAESIGKQAAYNIAKALFDCALEDAVAWPGPVILAPAREEDTGWAYEQAASVGLDFVQVIPQQAGNLGERINQLDRTIRNLGQPNTVFIGTDAPMLSSEHYSAVIDAMLDDGPTSHDIILSAAEDGGLVIMANRQPWPDLEALPWSQETLGNAVVELCQQSELSVGFIKSGYDIDVKTDLVKFVEYQQDDIRPARQILTEQIHRFCDQS